MKKVILNGCFGGYGWSKRGIIEVLKKKGFNNLHYFLGDDKVSYQEFCNDDSWDWFIATTPESTRYNENSYLRCAFDREDHDAIWVLEKFGSDFCSGDHARLYIEEFDDDLFLYDIDEYDGSESLDLIPNITEERVFACETLENVVELLKKTGVILRK